MQETIQNLASINTAKLRNDYGNKVSEYVKLFKGKNPKQLKKTEEVKTIDKEVDS